LEHEIPVVEKALSSSVSGYFWYSVSGASNLEPVVNG
jgi:hypothetical protein